MSNKQLPPKVPAPAMYSNKDARLELAVLLKQVLYRIRPVLSSKGTQSRMLLDKYIEAINPVIILRDDALPMAARPLIPVPDVLAILFNEIGHTLLTWGEIVKRENADIETGEATAASGNHVKAVLHGIGLLEKIADTGLDKFVAVPVSRGAAKHTLMTGGEYQEKKRADAAKAERVEQARIARMDAADKDADAGKD